MRGMVRRSWQPSTATITSSKAVNCAPKPRFCAFKRSLGRATRRPRAISRSASSTEIRTARSSIARALSSKRARGGIDLATQEGHDMWRKKCGRWLVWLGVVVGCNAKLSVDPGTGGAGGMTTGMAGKSADDAGSMDSPGVPAGGGAAEQAGGAGFAGTIAAGAVGVEGGAAGSGARAGMPDQPDPGNGGVGGGPPGAGGNRQPRIPGGGDETRGG